MVLIHGGAMCLGALKDSVPAILDAFYGGEVGADAIAAALFGAYNPTGKLVGVRGSNARQSVQRLLRLIMGRCSLGLPYRC
jgi:hypothetical protein